MSSANLEDFSVDRLCREHTSIAVMNVCQTAPTSFRLGMEPNGTSAEAVVNWILGDV